MLSELVLPLKKDVCASVRKRFNRNCPLNYKIHEAQYFSNVYQNITLKNKISKKIL